MNVEINPSEYKVLIVDDVISNVLLLKVLLFIGLHLLGYFETADIRHHHIQQHKIRFFFLHLLQSLNVEINPSEYKVLIVDDVISNVLLLKVLLTNEKFNIVTAGNGTQALEQVKKEKPDLAVAGCDDAGYQRFRSSPANEGR